MLRRLKVRARLMTVIAVPLVLLLVVAVPEVLQRVDRAGVADRAAGLARASRDISATVDALQDERVLSSALRAGAEAQVTQAVGDRRAATEAAIVDGVVALQRVAALSPALADVVATAVEGLDGLDDVRRQTDAARSIVPWVDPFAPLIESLLAVQEDLGSVVADAGVGDELTQAGLLARAKDATSAQAAQMAAATAWGELRGDQEGILTSLRGDELAYRTAYLAATPSADRVDRRAEVQQGAVTSAGRVVDEVIADGDVSSTGGLLRWLDVGFRRQAALQGVEAARAAEGLRTATELGGVSRQASTAYAALAGAGLVAALTLALFAARSITRPLRRLTEAADLLAEERLPRLVDALRNPGDDDERYLAASMEPIEVRSDDELAHLGRAFNAVQSVALDVAAQQADLLRKGISDLYVNLARRNQSLIERQIELLDRLEEGEADPDVLENLFSLDHLATRMRRNAESLLVLAGTESGPRRARPIPFADVVRAALSEVEDYGRVVLGVLAPATLLGPAVSDVAHLLAELLENATSFSSPDTTVRIDGLRAGGRYQLVITDHGVGMPADQLADLNAVLRDPPVTGLALGHSLGCLVAARLAVRHGIDVRLRAGERGGITAFVVVPPSLIDVDSDAVGLATAPRTLRFVEQRGPVTSAPIAPPLTDGMRSDVPAPPGGAGMASRPAPPVGEPGPALPARLRDALPPAAVVDAGLESLLGPRRERRGAEPAGSLDGGSPPHASVPGSPPDAGTEAQAGPLTDRLDRRETLARRVPGASTASFASESPVEQVRRSPDEVRAALSRYRSGLNAGRASTGSDREEGS